jgi:hypothetical protein
VPTVFRDLLENDIGDPSKATHRRVARFKLYPSMVPRLGVPNAEGAHKREILSAGRFEIFLIF